MISTKAYESMSYRQLQAVAKNLKVPANLKKCYLIRLLIARKNGNESLVQKIIENAYSERAHSKERQEPKASNIYENEDVLIDDGNYSNPNTELEKLLKAPISSKFSEFKANYRNHIGDNPQINRISRFSNDSCHSNIGAKKRKATRGRPRKDTLDTNSVESLGSQDLDPDKYYETKYFPNKGCKMCSDDCGMSTKTSYPSKPKIRKLTDPQMRMVNPKNQAPIFGSQQSGDYLSVDTWNNHENALYDNNGLANLSGNDAVSNSNQITNVTNVLTVDEYNRCSGREKVYSRYQSQQMTSSSEMTTFNSQDLYQHPNDNLYSKENYIVINQQFKFYSSTMPEHRKISPDTHIMQQQVYEDYNPKFPFITTKHLDQFKQSSVNNNQLNNSTINRNSKPYILNARAIDSSHVSKNQALHEDLNQNIPIEVNNNMNRIRKVEDNQSQIIEILDCDENYQDENNLCTKKDAANYSILNIASVSNENGDVSNTNLCEIPLKKNSQEDQNISIFEDIQNIDLRCDISEEISTTLEEYFNSLDLPTNPDAAPVVSSDEPPLISEENICSSQTNDWVENQTQGQWEVPFTPMKGIATSMICSVCDWLGKVSDFENHVRKQHIDYIFKAQQGMISIAVNMGDISKDANLTQQQYFIDHDAQLYIIYLKYKYPDIILPIILSVPLSGHITNENSSLAFEKFYIQVNNLVKKQEIVWSGNIECLNTPRRPLDVDVFSNRKHGRFELSMRSLDLIPNNLPITNIPQFLDGCVVEIHIFIEKLLNIKK